MAATSVQLSPVAPFTRSIIGLMSSWLAFCRAEAHWLRQTIERLVTLESPSHDKAAVDRLGSELASRLRAMGGAVDVLGEPRAGDHLRAQFGTGSPRILLLGHFDTVWPVGQLDRMPLVERDGRLYGPGVFDMKAGIGIGMLATRAWLEAAPPKGSVRLLLTTDEELGSHTSRGIIEEEARQSNAVFVLEPALPGCVLKTARKGCGEFQLTIHGVPAHAGVDPAKGVSAIVELAHQILGFERLRDLEHGISVNVGLVDGGSRPNVVAERATARIDVRAPTMADAARLTEQMLAIQPVLPGARLEITGGFERPPLERGPGVVRLFEHARAVAGEIGVRIDEGSTGGGSDGNFTAAVGVPTLDGLGAIGDGAHALHEHVEVASLPERAALVAGLIDRVVRMGV